jgi:hypothetical protein
MLKAARWGDNDHYFGPFTWSYSNSYPHWAVVLRSQAEEGGDGGQCTLRISLRKATLIVVLPGIVRPERKKVFPQWDAATVQRRGRNWYWDVTPRQYGVSLSDGHYTVYYGRVTHDSSTDQNKGGFLPWTQWRHVRRSLYGLDGRIFETVPERADYETWKALEDACPAARFSFEDYDGKVILATTRIEEREWHAGEGWFKWLSWFRRPKVRRTLDLSFSDEVGPEKGSWKGGMCGTSIEMLPGELHESAFRRFCEQEQRAKGRRYRIKFLMAVQ